MNKPPNQWRADGGYQTIPDPPPPVPNMFYFSPQSMYQCQPHISFVPAPVGINGLFMQPPPVAPINIPAPLGRITIPPPPPPQSPPAKKDKKGNQPPPKKDDDKKGGDKKDDGKKDEPKKNRFAPPELMPGTNYLFPMEMEHTKLHIFQKAAKVWEDKYKGQQLTFKIFYVDTQCSVKSVIARTLGIKDADKCKGWAVSEVIERGDHKWAKGTTIQYTSDKANGTLASMGWTARRGSEKDLLPPVWVTVHKV